MPKDFKTVEELIKLLESRGVATDQATAQAIKRESYYSIVNGYKDPFLDRQAMQSTSSDVYKVGTKFSEIYALFTFDRALRQLLFSYIAQTEATFKNCVVSAFCEKHRAHSAYLERSNYVTAKDMLVARAFKGDKVQLYQNNMARLMNILTAKLTKKRTKPYVSHYLKTYGEVPLWVLSNDLTFGNIAHFYQLQKRGVQNSACRLIAEATGKGDRIEPLRLLRAFDVLVEYRNVCAHDERLYSAEIKGAHFSDIAPLLRLGLTQEEMQGYRRRLEGLILEHRENFSPATWAEITDKMHLDT